MAIALESDFRSLKTSPMSEPAERRPAQPGNGDAFADTLRSARDADADKTEPNTAAQDAAAPIIPATAQATLPPSVPIEGEAGFAATAEANALSEIVIDRDIVHTDEKSEMADAPATDIAVDAVPTATLRADAAAIVPAAQGAPAANPTAPVPLTAEQIQAASGESVPVPAGIAVATATAVPASQTGPAAAKVAAPSAGQVASDGRQTAVKAKAAEAEAVPANTFAAALTGETTAEAAVTALAGTGGDTTSKPGGSDTGTLGAGTALAAAAPATPQAAAPVAVPAAMTPAHGIITASPAHVVDIVAQSAEDGQSDRIVIQLDPPELGRVSIDFKFDAQGLQHVTITGETPEAMRQLRMMHADLVQALERQGLGSQGMTFQHQQQQNAQHGPAQNAFARSAGLAESGASLAAAAPTIADQTTTARTMPGGRIDIRL